MAAEEGNKMTNLTTVKSWEAEEWSHNQHRPPNEKMMSLWVRSQSDWAWQRKVSESVAEAAYPSLGLMTDSSDERTLWKQAVVSLILWGLLGSRKRIQTKRYRSKKLLLIASNWMWGQNEVITCKLPRPKNQFPWELLFVVKVNPLNPPFNSIWIHLVCLLSFNQSSRRSQHSYPSKVTGWLPGWNYTFAPSPVRFMKRLVEN